MQFPNKTSQSLIVLAILSSCVNICQALDSELLKSNLKTDFLPDQCAETIKECLSIREEEEKSPCLDASSKSIACRNNPLRELAYTRSTLIASAAVDDTLLTSQTVDKLCVESFDNLFSAQLIKGELLSADLTKLESALQSCIEETPIDLHRQ